jgi:hypothetical protein
LNHLVWVPDKDFDERRSACKLISWEFGDMIEQGLSQEAGSRQKNGLSRCKYYKIFKRRKGGGNK